MHTAASNCRMPTLPDVDIDDSQQSCFSTFFAQNSGCLASMEKSLKCLLDNTLNCQCKLLSSDHLPYATIRSTPSDYRSGLLAPHSAGLSKASLQTAKRRAQKDVASGSSKRMKEANSPPALHSFARDILDFREGVVTMILAGEAAMLRQCMFEHLLESQHCLAEIKGSLT